MLRVLKVCSSEFNHCIQVQSYFGRAAESGAALLSHPAVFIASVLLDGVVDFAKGIGTQVELISTMRCEQGSVKLCKALGLV